jgi:hypothetical protein
VHAEIRLSHVKNNLQDGCPGDVWLRWHGCDSGGDREGGGGGFMGFWGWSAEHVLRGHPSQPLRGVLGQWLRRGE